MLYSSLFIGLRLFLYGKLCFKMVVILYDISRTYEYYIIIRLLIKSHNWNFITNFHILVFNKNLEFYKVMKIRNIKYLY